MKALLGGMGPDWALGEVPVPVPAQGQVLVRVRAAGVNRADLLMLEGAYNPEATWHTATLVAGLELAGEVAAVGEDVSGVKVSDRVMAATPFAFAQFAPVDYRHLVPVLEPTSWTDGAGADVVLDHVGGAPFGALLAATRPRGTIINIGRLAGRTATVDLDLLAFRRLRVLGTTFSIRSDEERGEVAAAVKAEVVPAVAAGRIRPVVDRVIPFADAPKAAELMRANAVTGKIVLDLAGVE